MMHAGAEQLAALRFTRAWFTENGLDATYRAICEHLDDAISAATSKQDTPMRAGRRTASEHNAELLAFLRSHFLNRLCWWSVSNNGDDFHIDVTENANPLFPCVTIKVYPSGKEAA